MKTEVGTKLGWYSLPKCDIKSIYVELQASYLLINCTCLDLLEEHAILALRVGLT